MLDHLQAADHVALRVGLGLAVLLRHYGGVLVHIPTDDVCQVEHVLLAGHDRGLRPGLVGGRGGLDGGVQFGLGGVGGFSDDLLGHWVFHVEELLALALHPLVVDEVLVDSVGEGS